MQGAACLGGRLRLFGPVMAGFGLLACGPGGGSCRAGGFGCNGTGRMFSGRGMHFGFRMVSHKWTEGVVGLVACARSARAGWTWQGCWPCRCGCCRIDAPGRMAWLPCPWIIRLDRPGHRTRCCPASPGEPPPGRHDRGGSAGAGCLRSQGRSASVCCAMPAVREMVRWTDCYLSRAQRGFVPFYRRIAGLSAQPPRQFARRDGPVFGAFLGIFCTGISIDYQRAAVGKALPRRIAVEPPEYLRLLHRKTVLALGTRSLTPKPWPCMGDNQSRPLPFDLMVRQAVIRAQHQRQQ